MKKNRRKLPNYLEQILVQIKGMRALMDCSRRGQPSPAELIQVSDMLNLLTEIHSGTQQILEDLPKLTPPPHTQALQQDVLKRGLALCSCREFLSGLKLKNKDKQAVAEKILADIEPLVRLGP